jgi:pimeloyl-ACP methyl ester carboxylesterase/uncharacterized membrane protein
MTATRALLAAIGVAALIVGARMIHAHRGSVEDRLLDTPTCRVPLTVLTPAASHVEGSTVIFHGIAASRRLMLTLGQQFVSAGLRVFLVDFPGHGDSIDPFSFSRVESCAVETVDTLARHNEITPGRTVLVGHSMGGAVAMRLADQFPTAATIAISPAPMVEVRWLPRNAVLFSPPRRMPNNLLIFTGAFEPSIIHEASEALLRDAGGERTSDSDFAEKRAAQLVIVPTGAHTSLIFDPRVARRSILWTRRALGPNAPQLNLNYVPEIGSALGMLGIILLLRLAVDVIAHFFGTSESATRNLALPSTGRTAFSLALWTIVSFAVVALLQLIAPLRFLHILSGDYYASFTLVAGLVLLLLIWMRSSRDSWNANAADALTPSRGFLEARRLSPLLFSACYAMLILFAVGAWLNWQTTDLWMNAVRWWRFALIVPFGLPFYLAEERVLGAPDATPRLRRWTLFLALRVIAWVPMALALLVFHNDQILIILLAPFLLFVAVAQRAGADSVRRRTGSAGAAALFSAILGAWFVAAVLPLT